MGSKNIVNKNIISLCFALSASLTAHHVEARPDYLTWWSDYYSKSSSDDMQCQLCHSEQGGGDGWNYYGWTIRNEAQQQQVSSQNDFLQILELIEADSASDLGVGCNLNNSATDATFFDMIRYNAQPGWVTAATNIKRTKDGTCITSLLPPAIPASANASIDLASPKGPPSQLQIDQTNLVYSLQQIAVGFDQTVQVVSAPNISGHVFVVERTGKIVRVDLSTGQKTVLLDDSSKLVSASSNTEGLGLLGLAFHPNFSVNGLFYTFQSRPLSGVSPDFTTMPTGLSGTHKSVIVEHNTPDLLGSVSNETKELLSIEQPNLNNNGGSLIFGQDGYLYIGLGDGGNLNDRGLGHGDYGNAQNTKNVLGSILRVDVNGTNSANSKYGIPSDNPFVGNANAIDEIFAYGVRNPKHASLNSSNGEVFFGDVGQASRLEINKIVSGANFAWSWKDGDDYFYSITGSNYLSDGAPAGIPENMADPMLTYNHSATVSPSVGLLYQGSALVGLQNQYLFFDKKNTNLSCGSSRIIASELSTQTAKALRLATEIPGHITAIGQDNSNDVYVVTNGASSQQSALFKLVLGQQPVTGLAAQCSTKDSFCVPVKATNGKIAVICL